MDFLKNHYEKVILGVVLLGVIIFAALLPGKIAAVQARLVEDVKAPDVGPGRPVKPLDMAPLVESLRVNANPPPLELSGAHNLFNPVRWRIILSGQPPEPQTAGHLDLKYFVITAIRPLKFAVWFDAVRGTGTSMRYQFMVLNEASAHPAGRRPTARTLRPAVGEKNEIFTITEIRGPVNDPNEMVVELVADKQLVTLGRGGREQGYQKQVGFEADATYEPARRTWKSMRPGYPVFLSEPWKVIAIDESSVTIESRTQKRETKQLEAAARP